MPAHKYVKPKDKVIDIYRGDEIVELIQPVVERLFSRDGEQISNKKVKQFLNYLIGSWLGGDIVLIIEHLPLNSEQARGKKGNDVYSVIGKTGTQRVTQYKIPDNPRTKPQMKHRSKYGKAVAAWNKLPEQEKEKYRKKSIKLKMSGYNLFLKNYMKSN